MLVHDFSFMATHFILQRYALSKFIWKYCLNSLTLLDTASNGRDLDITDKGKTSWFNAQLQKELFQPITKTCKLQ